MIIKKNKGYILIYKPDHPNCDKQGYVFEHRYRVELKINRYLNKEEKVHHLDEVKTNNQINNLMLFKNQKEHQRFHLKIKQFGLTNPIKRQIKNRWDDINNYNGGKNGRY